MAVRTTSSAVQKIIEIDSTIVTDLSPHIETANNLVNQVCLSSSYSTETLELIERWLAAHFAGIHGTRYASEEAATKVTYQVVTDMHLNATLWGQQAMVLDTMGNLAALNEQAKDGGKAASISVVWLGTSKG